MRLKRVIDIFLGVMFTPWKINMVHLQITHLERKMIFQTSSIVFHVNHQAIMFMSTLPKFNSSPLKSYRNPIGKANVFQPSIFRGELLNLGGLYVYEFTWPWSLRIVKTQWNESNEWPLHPHPKWRAKDRKKVGVEHQRPSDIRVIMWGLVNLWS